MPGHPPAVEFSHVSLAFDEHVVLSDLSLSIPKGAMRILLGVSGSGKSVILKLVLGLIRPDAGEIRLNGARVDTMTEAELLRLRKGIGMVFQENALFDSLTVAENVGFGLTDRDEGTADEVRARVDEVLGFVGLAEYGSACRRRCRAVSAGVWRLPAPWRHGPTSSCSTIRSRGSIR